MNAQHTTPTARRRSSTARWFLGGLLGAGLALSLSAGLAVADDGESQKPDRAALQVCKEQIQAVCGDVEPGEGRIRACVEENADAIDPQCRELAERKADSKKGKKKKGKKGRKGNKGNKKARKQLEQACRADIEQACGDVEPGDGRIKACIAENVESFSPACQQALEEVRERR